MKKAIILFFILTSALFPQSWNNAVQTSIPYVDGSGTGIDEFVNKDGVSVLVDYHTYNYPNHIYYLKYYLLNSSGTIIRNYTFENQEVEFASIDGNNDKIYVVYKLGNQIKTRKSTDAGQNWTSLGDVSIGNNNCNSIDIIYDKNDNALHMVWSTQDAGSDYKTYYRRLSNDQWGSQENVTDGSLVGGFPTVSTSTNRVHVSYNTGHSSDPSTNLGEANTRDKYNSTWQTPQLVYSPQSFRERVHGGSTKLFDFYYQLEEGLGQYTSVLYVKNRDLGSTSWSSPIELNYGADVYNIVSASNSFDGKTHIVYSNDAIYYRNFDGSNWSSEYALGNGYATPKLSANSNDLYVVWGGNYGTNYVYYRQYDAIPSVPSNLSMGANPGNGLVRLEWDKNLEPDIYSYSISRKIDEEGTGWLTIGTTTNNYFIDSEMFYAPTGGLVHSHYKIRAIDLNNHYSDYSSEVTARTEPLNKEFVNNVNHNELKNSITNYPNPFNPLTKIIYSITQDGLVTIKIYNVLGKEISTLVNESKSAGIYETEFNATQLPSGMYIYKIQSGNFTDVKKMLLTK